MSYVFYEGFVKHAQEDKENLRAVLTYDDRSSGTEVAMPLEQTIVGFSQRLLRTLNLTDGNNFPMPA